MNAGGKEMRLYHFLLQVLYLELSQTGLLASEKQVFAEKDLFAETEVSCVKISLFLWKFYQEGFLSPG